MQLGRRVALQGEELRAWQEARLGQSAEGPTVVQAAITDADTEAAPDLQLPPSRVSHYRLLTPASSAQI